MGILVVGDKVAVGVEECAGFLGAYGDSVEGLG